LPSSAPWYGLAYGNGIFVATSQLTTSAASSTDGVTWNLRTMPTSAQWQAVTYGNGLFVALTINSTTAASSTDGITWSLRTLPASANYYSVAYGNGIFTSLSQSTSAAISSTDGITWTLRTLPTIASWWGLTYSNGIFVAPAQNSTTTILSTNGITWSLSTLPASSSWIAISSAPFQSSINALSLQGQMTPLSYINATTYTVGTYEKYLNFNLSATCTITLPNAGTYPNREILIKNNTAFAINSASSNVLPLGSNTAGTAILAATASKYARLVSDGYNWVTMEAN
jgi:hypothetical protein